MNILGGGKSLLTNPQNIIPLLQHNLTRRPMRSKATYVLTIRPQILNISWCALLASYSGVPFTPLSWSMTEHLYLLYHLASRNLTSHLETFFFKKSSRHHCSSLGEKFYSPPTKLRGGAKLSSMNSMVYINILRLLSALSW